MNNDLISRSRLMELARNHIGGTVDCNDIARFPGMDAEPVRHGRYDAGGDCTVCGYPMPTDDRCDTIFPDEIKYCYNCGAKMDAEVEG